MCNSDALSRAITAVCNDEPDKPIELAPETWVRAAWLVEAMTPEILARARAHVAQAHLLRDIGLTEADTARHLAILNEAS